MLNTETGKDDEAGGISQQDGRDHPVESMGRNDQTVLSEGRAWRPVRGIETMLRMYLMQTWFNLSDEGTEDAIYDSYAMRSFLGINFMTEQVPDATTLLKFRNRRMS